MGPGGKGEHSLLRISSFYLSSAGGQYSVNHMDRVSCGRPDTSKGHLFLLGTGKEILHICVTQMFFLLHSIEYQSEGLGHTRQVFHH